MLNTGEISPEETPLPELVSFRILEPAGLVLKNLPLALSQSRAQRRPRFGCDGEDGADLEGGALGGGE